jgi:hypothetical protein
MMPLRVIRPIIKGNGCQLNKRGFGIVAHRCGRLSNRPFEAAASGEFAVQGLSPSFGSAPSFAAEALRRVNPEQAKALSCSGRGRRVHTRLRPPRRRAPTAAKPNV